MVVQALLVFLRDKCVLYNVISGGFVEVNALYYVYFVVCVAEPGSFSDRIAFRMAATGVSLGSIACLSLLLLVVQTIAFLLSRILIALGRCILLLFVVV